MIIDLGFWDINGNYIEDIQEIENLETNMNNKKEELTYFTLNILSNVLNLSQNTIRSWLNGYRFSKFKIGMCEYKCSKEFLNNLKQFLLIKRKYKAIKNLENYINNFIIKG